MSKAFTAPLRLRASSTRNGAGLLITALATTLATAPGCASFGFGGPRASVSEHTLALMGPPSSETEREGRLEHQKPDINEKAVEGAFWGGVVAGSVGTAMAVGFGAAGQVTSGTVADAYDDGVTLERRDELVQRGETFNALAITGAAIGVTGLAIAAITYGIDRTRCGRMRRKKDDCQPN